MHTRMHARTHAPRRVLTALGSFAECSAGTDAATAVAAAALELLASRQVHYCHG
jgi:hypothetical protein